MSGVSVDSPHGAKLQLDSPRQAHLRPLPGSAATMYGCDSAFARQPHPPRETPRRDTGSAWGLPFPPAR